MLLPRDVFPTPGGPTRQRIGPRISWTRESTATWSRIRSFTSSKPKWAASRTVAARRTSMLSRERALQGRDTIQSRCVRITAASGAIAFGGIGLAALFFLRRRDLADRAAARWTRLHQLLLNKFYVDEFYDAAIVRPIRVFSERWLWRGFDEGLVDGGVNGVGTIVSGAAASLRRLQTGSVRAYATSIILGAILVLGYYFWR